jgi:hypothetical protein
MHIVKEWAWAIIVDLSNSLYLRQGREDIRSETYTKVLREKQKPASIKIMVEE